MEFMDMVFYFSMFCLVQDLEFMVFNKVFKQQGYLYYFYSLFFNKVYKSQVC